MAFGREVSFRIGQQPVHIGAAEEVALARR